MFLDCQGRDTFLTECFHEPHHLDSTTNFVTRNWHFATEFKKDSYLGTEKAIVIRREHDRQWAFVVLLAALVVFSVIGLVAGIFWKNANVGLAVGACLFAFVSSFEGLLMLLYL